MLIRSSPFLAYLSDGNPKNERSYVQNLITAALTKKQKWNLEV